jgi:AAA family ATP:ADP antiporter
MPFLRRVVDVRPEERRAVGWSFLAFFCLLTSYYVLRAIRDGHIAATPGRLTVLYEWTFGSMLVLVSAWSWVLGRLPRARVLPFVYRFFVVNLLVFFALFRLRVAAAPQVFFVWLSVFNFFAVAVFWSVMADVFAKAQGKRLFGFIAAGGSAGAIVGPLLTTLLVHRVGAANLVLLSAVLLALVAECVARLVRLQRTPSSDDVVGGGVLSGIKVVFASRYLLAIAAYTLLVSLSGTYGYNLQAHLVQAAHLSEEARIAFFARLDLVVSVAALLVQSLVIGRVLTRFGVGTALALIPPLSSVSFLVLAARPVLPVSTGLHVLRRVLAYSVWGPANGVLFTVVDREQKYKSKAFIETVVFRGGDVLASTTVATLLSAGRGVRGAALLAVPLGVLWLGVALILGRMHRRIAEDPRKPG